MQTLETMAPSIRLVLTLAIEATVIFGLAALLSRWVGRASGRRMLWRLSCLAAAAITLAELSGAARGAAIWMQPAPPVARTPVGRAVVTVFPEPISPPAGAELTRSPRVVPPAPSLAEAEESALPAWLIVAVLLGVAGFVARRLTTSLCLGFVLRGRPVTEADLAARTQALAARLGIRRRVRVREYARLPAPIAFGILRPVLGLPAGFARNFTTAQQDVMLAHELAHIAAGDAAWLVAADLATALLWWHPLAWWARHRLRTASEAAADEASLLIDNGPATLAECLVTLGARLVQAPTFGALGMADAGFRSSLGQRVRTLLALRGQSWPSTVGPWTRLVRGVSPAALVIAAVGAAAALQPRAADAVTPGEAFARSPFGLAMTALLPVEPVAFPSPTNAVTTPAAPSASAARSSSRRAVAPLEERRRALLAKLDSIILPEVIFDGVPCSRVVASLAEQARRADPDQRGVNFILKGAAAVDSLTGLPTATPDPGGLSNIPIRLTPALRHVTLRQALEAVVRSAQRPLEYSIEAYGIVISSRNATEAEPLHTRSFKVDPDTLRRGLQRAQALPAPSGYQTNDPQWVGDRGSTNRNTLPLEVFNALRDYLLAGGVELESPKALFYNDRLGQLMVRATLPNLDAVEQALQTLNTSPPQVLITVKLCEVSEEAAAALGLDWLPREITNAPAPFADPLHMPAKAQALTRVGVLTDPQTRVVMRALEQRAGVEVLTTPRVTTLSGRQAQIKVVDVRYIVTDLDTNPPPATAADATTPETPATEKSWNYHPIAKQFELGPIVDVVPFVEPDGETLRLNLIASLKDFIGYDSDPDAWKQIPHYGDPAARPAVPPEALRPRPLFRTRQLAVNASLQDGETLVLSGGEAIIGGPDGAASTRPNRVPLDPKLIGPLRLAHANNRKTFLVFVTPRLVDATGHPLHPAQEQPSRPEPRNP